MIVVKQYFSNLNFHLVKENIHWSLFTHRDEQNIDAELKSMKKFSKNKNETTEVTTRLKYVIKAIDGDEDKAKIKSLLIVSFLREIVFLFVTMLRKILLTLI